MLGGVSTQQLIFWIIVLIAFGLLITERMRNDMVALLIILSLAITGVLAPDQGLSGFSSEPAIVVAAIFVLSGALPVFRFCSCWHAAHRAGGSGGCVLGTVNLAMRMA